LPYREAERLSARRNALGDYAGARLMKQVVDRLYTVLLRPDDPEFVDRMDQYARRATAKWDEPRNLTDWFSSE
jgi:hypothetical protein